MPPTINVYEQIAISSAAIRLQKAFLYHCRVQIPGDYALSNLSDFVQPVTADDVLPYAGKEHTILT
jgi:hypothetical protein